MAQNVIEAYQVALKPLVDSQAWENATNTIQSKVSSLSKKTSDFKMYKQASDEANEKLKNLTIQRDKAKSAFENAPKETSGEDLEKLLGNYDKLNDEVNNQVKVAQKADTALTQFQESTTSADLLLGTASTGLTTAIGVIGGLVTAIIAAVTAVKSLGDTASNVSNKFVSGNSMFVDSGTKNLMAKYGTSNTQAQAVQATLDVTGYQLEDIATWTKAQRENYTDLVQKYQKGLQALDSSKLQRYNKATQEYQKTLAEFQMNLQLGLIDFLTSSDVLPELLTDVGGLLQNIEKVLSSPFVKWGFEVIGNILDLIVKIGEFGTDVVSSLLGGDNNKGQTVNNITVQTNVDNTKSTVQSNQSSLKSMGIDMSLLLASNGVTE